MKEIEVKFLDIDADGLMKRLHALGAKKIFSGRIFSENYDFPDRRLSKQGVTLRLRNKGDYAEFTLKKKTSKVRAKISDEYETRVSDYAEMRKILQLAGLKPRLSYTKLRTSYSLDGAHYEFDKVEGIPAFLEIEASSIRDLGRAAEAIGLKMADSKPWGLRDVLRYYRR